MEEFSIPKKEREWQSETLFLNSVYGNYIADQIKSINDSGDAFVIATQPFLKSIDSNGNATYDVFIYYKKKAGGVQDATKK